MNNIKKILIAAAVMLIVAGGLFGQTTGTASADVTISAVAILGVNTATSPSFTVDDTGIAAGELPVITPSGGPTYLQYTVVVATGATKKITAQSDTAMLNGLKMDVWAAAPTGTGDVGDAVAGGLEITPSYTPDTPADLITGIESCATGSGTTQGPAVYYTLSIDASTFADMEVTGATTYTITYTLTDG